MADKVFIVRENRGEARHVHLLLVADEHFFLQRDVYAHVWRARLLVAVIEGIEKGIPEKNPVKALRIEIRSHEGAIGEADVEIQFVENAVEVSGIACCFGCFFLVGEPLGVLGLEIVVGIAKHRFGCGDEFRIVVAQAEHAALVGRRGHRVDIGIVGKTRVRMIVIDGNALDLL